jgi:hypothetical protein
VGEEEKMIDWTQFATTFRTYDKLYHFIGSAGLFFMLSWIHYHCTAWPKGKYLWPIVGMTFIAGVLYEVYQLLTGQWFDFYDLTANCVGIGLAWCWVKYWTR